MVTVARGIAVLVGVGVIVHPVSAAATVSVGTHVQSKEDSRPSGTTLGGTTAPDDITVSRAGPSTARVAVRNDTLHVSGFCKSETLRTAVCPSENVEMYLGGGDDRVLVQGAVGVSVFGGKGRDRLTGGSDGDYLEGGPGLDTLRGGSGNDTLAAGLRDLVDGGPGRDRVSYRDLKTPIRVDLRLASALRSIEGVEGGYGDDVLIGTDGPNVLGGGLGGDDRLSGLGGDDVLTGSDDGDVRLFGGTGDDELSDGRLMFGGPGNDRLESDSTPYAQLRGGPGNDRLFAFFDSAYMWCGPGDDTIVRMDLATPVVGSDCDHAEMPNGLRIRLGATLALTWSPHCTPFRCRTTVNLANRRRALRGGPGQTRVVFNQIRRPATLLIEDSRSDVGQNDGALRLSDGPPRLPPASKRGCEADGDRVLSANEVVMLKSFNGRELTACSRATGRKARFGAVPRRDDIALRGDLVAVAGVFCEYGSPRRCRRLVQLSDVRRDHRWRTAAGSPVADLRIAPDGTVSWRGRTWHPSNP